MQVCKMRDAGWEHTDGKQGRSDCEVIKGPSKEQKKKCKEGKKNSNGL